MDNKQQIYENKLHERFPNAHFTILNFTIQSAPATIRCDDCGLIRNFKQASALLPKQSFCPRCKSEYFQKFKKLCEEFQVEILNYDKVKTNIPIIYITYKQIDQIKSILTSLKSSTTSPMDVGEINDFLRNGIHA